MNQEDISVKIICKNPSNGNFSFVNDDIELFTDTDFLEKSSLQEMRLQVN